MDGRILTLDEVSRLLRVNRATVYRMARKQKIPAAKVGRQWRFERERIDEWLKRQYA
ncbi:helix-turn-helix domain-containing protein [Candidatus Uhrbacteria bacterium]|nr:helix-turn-helix domain-containing protein [Candidatus Uhrbacteria bacterium]